MPLRLSPVIPGLYQGPESAANDAGELRRCGVTHIVSLGARAAALDGVAVLRIGCKDATDADLGAMCDEAFPFMDACFHQRAASAPGSVLVHCKAGLSRSPAVVVAYLVARHGFTVEGALGVLRQATGRRVQPNAGFLAQLGALEGAHDVGGGVNGGSGDAATRLPSRQANEDGA
eukprot:Rhum_TRINITY_DN14768_c15_g1::Rhum_TRINITY_DN14768_c15_g1_i1::g.117768::m.117768/K17614/DUSP3, VHR; dual specificity phosphatase 3